MAHFDCKFLANDDRQGKCYYCKQTESCKCIYDIDLLQRSRSITIANFSQTVTDKCMASHVGNNNIPPYTYGIQSLPLPNVVTAVKDLDVMFDVKLKFNVHINEIVVKSVT